jgi:Na+-translocating ferredoxin:NAD+ oxidoreductase subunit G
MGEMIKMVVVLTLLSSLSGGLLAYVKEGTKEQIENQVLQLVQGPAVAKIFAGASNNPVTDRFTLTDGEQKVAVFVAKFDGKPKAVALEALGKGGYGGPVGLMVGIDVNTDKIYGVSVTTSSETPSLGGRAKSDPKFAAQFDGMDVTQPIQITGDGGKVNALSGATFTSRAVCLAATEAGQLYERLKPQIEEKLNEDK